MATTDFEVKFGILADSQISDKVPSINSYKLGFQVVDKNEDDTEAIGIIAYKIGAHLIYIPVFWLNGRLKGGDIMYLKKEDMFLPFNEVWINFVESGKQFSVGNTEHKSSSYDSKGSAYRTSTVNLTWLHNKRASGNVMLADPDDVVPMFIEKQGPSISLGAGLQVFSKKAAADLAEAMMNMPVLANALFTQYSPEELKTIFAQRFAADMTANEEKSRLQNEVKVHIKDWENPPAGLGTVEKAELVKDGIYIEDKRKETSAVYVAKKSNNKYASPTKTGKYNVILADFSAVPRVVLINNNPTSRKVEYASVNCCSPSGTYDNKCVVYNPKNNNWLDVKADTMMVETIEDADSIKALSDIGEKVTLQTIKSMADSGKDFVRTQVALIDPTGITFIGDFTLGSAGNVSFRTGWEFDPFKVVYTDKPGKMFIDKLTTLYIPEGCRMVELKYNDKKEDYSTFANPGSIFQAMGNNSDLGLESVKIASDGITYSIQSKFEPNKGTLGYTEALLSLVKKHGIAAKEAKDMIHQIRAEGRRIEYTAEANYYVKMASDAFDDTFDDVNDEGAQGDDRTNTKETITSTSNGGGISNADVDSIYKASQLGVKEVLDTTVLSQLAKSAYPVDRVGDFLPTCVKTLDKLGRIIMLFYSHNDEFADRYGTQNLPSIEDALKDNMKRLGDLVIYLQEKTITADEALDSAEGDLTREMV